MVRIPSDTENDSRIFIDPLYLRGEFYEKSTGGSDATYKVGQLLQLLERNRSLLSNDRLYLADVGCGTGETTLQLSLMLSKQLNVPLSIEGYDIHPYIKTCTISETIRFIHGDFCNIADRIYDLVVLFDVIEHVPDPITFLKLVSNHARLLALHIPLDDALLTWLRNLPQKGLDHPGHILVLDLPATMNLLAFSGLRVLDYAFSPSFRAPTGKETLLQKVLYPIRSIFYKLSPYLTQKIFAGVSVTILARTKVGLVETINEAQN